MIRVLGDGVAGRLVARELRARGRACVVHGDGRAMLQPSALVHRYAGRSFRRPELENQAWEVARAWLDEVVAAGAASRLEIARPIDSRAGERLAATVEFAPEARRERLPFVGECFVYGPAFVIDVPAALQALSPVDASTPDEAAVIAAGASWDHPDVEKYGGQLAIFEWEEEAVDFVVSGGGIHIAPFAGGASVGSTFWPQGEAMAEEDAVAELRRRAGNLGVRLGEARSVWTGTRAVSSDRRPLIGGAPLAVGALGTRGWFWGPYCAKAAVDLLLDDKAVPAELCVARFGQ